MINSLFLILFTLSPLSFADGGFTEGNGGDVIACRDANDTITSVELLDYYEARVIMGTPSTLDPSQNYEEAMESLLQRLTVFDTHFREKLEEDYAEFFDNAKFLTGVVFKDISDSDHIGVPVGCAIEQIAVQRHPRFPGERRFVINKDLWDALDGNNQAGLILHELLFRFVTENRKNGTFNSRGTRYLVGLVAAGGLSNIGRKGYLELIENEFHIGYSNYDGHLISTSVTFHDDGSVKTISPVFHGENETIVVTDSIELIAKKNSRAVFEYFEGGTNRKYMEFEVAELEDSKTQTLEYRGFRVNLVKDKRISIDFNQSQGIVSLRGVGFMIRHPYIRYCTESSGGGQPCESEDYFKEHFCESIKFTDNGFINCTLSINNSFLNAGGFNAGNPYNSRSTEVLLSSTGRMVHATQGSRPDDDGKVTIYFEVDFFQNGHPRIAKCRIAHGSWGYTVPSGTVEDKWTCGQYPNREVEFWESTGHIKSGGRTYVYANTNTGIRITGRAPINCNIANPYYEGYENNQPKYITPGNTVTDIRLPDGSLSYADPADLIHFGENGQVLSVDRGVCGNHN